VSNEITGQGVVKIKTSVSVANHEGSKQSRKNSTNQNLS